MKGGGLVKKQKWGPEIWHEGFLYKKLEPSFTVCYSKQRWQNFKATVSSTVTDFTELVDLWNWGTNNIHTTQKWTASQYTDGQNTRRRGTVPPRAQSQLTPYRVNLNKLRSVLNFNGPQIPNTNNGKAWHRLNALPGALHKLHFPKYWIYFKMCLKLPNSPYNFYISPIPDPACLIFLLNKRCDIQIHQNKKKKHDKNYR